MASKKSAKNLPEFRVKTIHLLQLAFVAMAVGTACLVLSFFIPISDACQYGEGCSALENASGYLTMVGVYSLPIGMIISLLTLTWKSIKTEGKQK